MIPVYLSLVVLFVRVSFLFYSVISIIMSLSDHRWDSLKESIYYELLSKGYIDNRYVLYARDFSSLTLDFSYEFKYSLRVYYDDGYDELSSYDIELYKLKIKLYGKRKKIYGIIVKFTDFYVYYGLFDSGRRCDKLLRTAIRYLKEFSNCKLTLRQLIVRLLHLVGRYQYFKSSFSVRDEYLNQMLKYLHYDSIVESCG